MRYQSRICFQRLRESMRFESEQTVTVPKCENKPPGNRARLIATGPQTSIRVLLKWIFLTINHSQVMSYRWVYKLTANINSENCGEKLNVVGLRFPLAWQPVTWPVNPVRIYSTDELKLKHRRCKSSRTTLTRKTYRAVVNI